MARVLSVLLIVFACLGGACVAVAVCAWRLARVTGYRGDHADDWTKEGGLHLW